MEHTRLNLLQGREFAIEPLLTEDEPMRFVVFGIHNNVPNGGWNDIVGCYPNEDEARKAGNDLVESKNITRFHVVDLVKKHIIYDSRDCS